MGCVLANTLKLNVFSFNDLSLSALRAGTEDCEPAEFGLIHNHRSLRLGTH